MGRVVGDCVIVLGDHVGEVAGRTVGVPVAEKVQLVHPIHRVFHHQLGQLLVLDLVVLVGVEGGELLVADQVEVPVLGGGSALKLQLKAD